MTRERVPFFGQFAIWPKWSRPRLRKEKAAMRNAAKNMVRRSSFVRSVALLSGEETASRLTGGLREGHATSSGSSSAYSRLCPIRRKSQ